MSDQIILYSYYRSSASYRVRIALHHKKIPFEYRSINLVKDGGQQFSDDYKKLNPLAQVPCLVHHDRPITQSLAIIQYLEEICPQPALLPSEPYDRALVWQICEILNSGIQPFQNRAVIAELGTRFGANEEARNAWIHHFIYKGFDALEEVLKKTSGQHCFGDTFGAADCCLVPQVFGAKRFGADITRYPTILNLNERAMAVDAVQLSEPSRQPDFVAT